MDVRAQISMVFNLDKCIGCHTCSIACKNVWTDRKGAEYMWWNNVETKPGTGYPTKWEDQDIYQGGWEKRKNRVSLKGTGRVRGLKNIFHNPHLPVIDDYYEPWTYKYQDLFDAPEGADQPTARPVSLITHKEIDVKSGPNWDDDLGGSPVYAREDINLKHLAPSERQIMFQLEKMALFYLPRICNHCLNPACVAACPSGAIYKRGEDGIVLINQKRCRAWRMCVTACPYKKSYYNWNSGKSEKCLLCYPRVETGQAPACMHSCVGRIRYLGVLLYDASRIEKALEADENQLIQSQKDIILDPHLPEVVCAAKRCGVHYSTVEAAQKSPVYKLVKQWGLALPLHPEYRTLPMLFYVPPLLPTVASVADGIYDSGTEELFQAIDHYRFPLKYLASLFSAGDENKIRHVLVKLMAVRHFRRHETVGDLAQDGVNKLLAEAGFSEETANEVYKLTALAGFNDRFVIPPAHREEAVEMLKATADHKGSAGFGFRDVPVRGL